MNLKDAVALAAALVVLPSALAGEPYAWRGLMLDESRFFFGKEVVKETMDRMAACRLNVFHWHLTDDQGWRLEIRGCPELTTVGAFRKSSPKVHTEAEPDGKPYGPFFYTEADVKEIVAYAAARGIRVVPEIELPGHIGALLTAHPEFSCRGEISPNLICSMAIYEDVLCVGNDAAIRYLEHVLDDVCRLFPDEVVHIGGDECPTVRWAACPKCRARMKAEGIGEVRGLQSWVTHHFARYLEKKGRRAMGWDEILEGDGCPTNVIVQSWRTPDPRRDGKREPTAVRAARRGHDVVLSPLKTLYFSLPAGPDDPGEYRKPVASYAANFGYVTPEKVRAFRPDAGFPPELKGRILGAECCCWSEGTRTGPILHQKTWPRAAIFAETLKHSKH